MLERCRMLVVLLFLLLTPMACENIKIRPTVDGDTIGIAVVIDEETAEKFEDGVSRFEKGVERVAGLLDGIAVVSRAVGVISKDEHVDEAAEGVGDVAEQGAAGAVLLLGVAGILRNLMKKGEEG